LDLKQKCAIFNKNPKVPVTKKVQNISDNMITIYENVSSKQSESFNYIKKPDSKDEVKRMITKIAHHIKQGMPVRVSQAYEGVGHTFGIIPKDDSICVADHSEDRLYRHRVFPQYNALLNGISKQLGLPITFAPKNPLSLEDEWYKILSEQVDGACVYYADTYVFQSGKRSRSCRNII